MTRYAWVLLPGLLLAVGCAQRTPTALIGKWDRTEDNGLFKTTTRLTLAADGRFFLTRIAPDVVNPLSGPKTEDGEIIESGTYTANRKAIRFSVTTVYLDGRDVGSTLGGRARLAYTLNGDTMTIDNATLPLAYNSSGIPDPRLAPPPAPPGMKWPEEPPPAPSVAPVRPGLPEPIPEHEAPSVAVPVDPVVSFTRVSEVAQPAD